MSLTGGLHCVNSLEANFVDFFRVYSVDVTLTRRGEYHILWYVYFDRHTCVTKLWKGTFGGTSINPFAAGKHSP